MTVLGFIHTELRSGVSRIFLGGANSQSGLLTYYFANFFYQKLHENERISNPQEGTHPWCPLGSANATLFLNIYRAHQWHPVDASSPSRSNFFMFMPFSAKKLLNDKLVSPLGFVPLEILDPPLSANPCKFYTTLVRQLRLSMEQT